MLSSSLHPGLHEHPPWCYGIVISDIAALSHSSANHPLSSIHLLIHSIHEGAWVLSSYEHLSGNSPVCVPEGTSLYVRSFSLEADITFEGVTGVHGYSYDFSKATVWRSPSFKRSLSHHNTHPFLNDSQQVLPVVSMRWAAGTSHWPTLPPQHHQKTC